MPAHRSTTKDPTTNTLQNAANELTTINATLNDLYRNWTDPPEPDKPAAVDATNTILAQAANITSIANAIMLKLRGGA